MGPWVPLSALTIFPFCNVCWVMRPRVSVSDFMSVRLTILQYLETRVSVRSIWLSVALTVSRNTSIVSEQNEQGVYLFGTGSGVGLRCFLLSV